jgi:hypothetical protein
LQRRNELHQKLILWYLQLRVIRNASHRGACEHHQQLIPIAFALLASPDESSRDGALLADP